jgi:hypothetical protein
MDQRHERKAQVGLLGLNSFSYCPQPCLAKNAIAVTHRSAANWSATIAVQLMQTTIGGDETDKVIVDLFLRVVWGSRAAALCCTLVDVFELG